MSDSVVYMRGNFPFGFERPINAELVADAKLTLAVEVDTLKAIAAELEEYKGFLDWDALQSVIGNYIPDQSASHRIARLISAVDSRLRSTDQKIDDFLRSLRAWQESEDNEDGKLLTPAEADELVARLPLVLRPYPGLKLQAKAKRLSAVLGMPLEGVEIICDLRPVFDDGKEHVEGMIPFTTLKVVCQGHDGLPVAIEAVMGEQAVVSLAKKANDAVQKLKHLREVLAAKEFRVPSVNLTKRGE